MSATGRTDVYSPREIARAAGVPDEQAIAAAGGADALIGHRDAVRMARALRGHRGGDAPSLFSIFAERSPVIAPRQNGVTLALSGTAHAAGIAALIVITAFGLDSTAKTLNADHERADAMRLVYLIAPGPGGGGGGGGLMQRTPPPKALREGKRPISSPLPVRRPPPPVEPTIAAPEPTPPPLHTEALPAIVAPIAAAPADDRDRVGILEQVRAEKDSHGPGTGAGTGTGSGTGIGEGKGSGVGPGAGGGTGGGPFRPGSGIEPPRLLHEVKADYPEDARQRHLEGEVELEIVVRRDGSVGDIKILKGLSAGLNDRAVQAVKQWRFSPARRLGTPVDVIVDVSVEFRMR